MASTVGEVSTTVGATCGEFSDIEAAGIIGVEVVVFVLQLHYKND